MQVICFTEFSQNLSSTFDYVQNNHAPMMIKREHNSVVVLSLDDYNAHMETIYLMSNPANAQHLMRGIEEFHQQRCVQLELIDTC